MKVLYYKGEGLIPSQLKLGLGARGDKGGLIFLNYKIRVLNQMPRGEKAPSDTGIPVPGSVSLKELANNFFFGGGRESQQQLTIVFKGHPAGGRLCQLREPADCPSFGLLPLNL